MPSRLARLRALESRYNGPIPNAERDAALCNETPTRRTARYRMRIYRQAALNAIDASARWRESEWLYRHLSPRQALKWRLVLICTMVHATRRYLAWRIYGASSGKGRDSES